MVREGRERSIATGGTNCVSDGAGASGENDGVTRRVSICACITVRTRSMPSMRSVMAGAGSRDCEAEVGMDAAWELGMDWE